MVQQLALIGTATQEQLKLTLDSLTTYTGSPPSHFETLTVLSNPLKIVKFEPNSKNTQYEQHKFHLKTAYNKEYDTLDKYKQWILQTVDIPSAGKRKISVQMILESFIDLNKSQNIKTVMNDLGYDLDVKYIIKGDRFFHGNITIEIFQIEYFKNNELNDEIINFDKNLYLVKSYINVEKATDVDHLNKAGQELLTLKGDLQGLIELEIPDRNSMDSRIGLRK